MGVFGEQLSQAFAGVLRTPLLQVPEGLCMGTYGSSKSFFLLIGENVVPAGLRGRRRLNERRPGETNNREHILPGAIPQRCRVAPPAGVPDLSRVGRRVPFLFNRLIRRSLKVR